MHKIFAYIAAFLVVLSGVYAWGEGNASQTHYIHWQPQTESCSIPGMFKDISGYRWHNTTINQTICMPFGSRNSHVSQLSGDTIVLPSTTLSHTNTTNLIGTPTITIADNFPQGADYVFTCEIPNLTTPASFDWDFGDGSKLYDLNVSNTYHSFINPGQYHITCVGNDGVQNIPAYTIINVTPQQTTPAVMLYIAATDNSSTHFVCQERGFFPTHYDWNFGDNTSITTTSREVIHTFLDGKDDHIVECTARNNMSAADDFIYVYN